MNKLIKFSGFLFFISLVISCSDEEVEIAILHTNDIHGEIYNMAKIAALKESLNANYDTVLLFSAGDMFSGNPYVDFYTPKGYPMIDLMNKVGYNLAVLGNHEFDYGPDILKDRLDQSEFPFLCANVRDTSGILSENIIANHVISINDIILEFTGLIETENNGKPSTHPKQVVGLEFTPAMEKLKEISPSNTSNHSFLLNHLGYETDSVIAVNYPHYKVIIGGHSHTLIDSAHFINDVLVAQAGDNSEHIGLIKLKFKNGELIDRSYELINLDKLTELDSSVDTLIQSYLSNPELENPIAEATTTLKDRVDMAAMITDAQRITLDVDFSFQNYWGIRIDSIGKGEISKGTIFEMDPFNNEVIITKMTASEIESLLTNAYISENRIDLFISGGTYTIYKDSTGNFKQIELLGMDNKALNPLKIYTVALSSYVANSYKFDYSGELVGSKTTTAVNTINYLKDIKTVDSKNTERAFLKVQ